MQCLDRLRATEISLKHLTVQVVAVPHRQPFRSAIGQRRERHAVFVTWADWDGAWGLGECACRPDPYFNGEFVDGAVSVLRDYIFPLLPSRGAVCDAEAVVARMRGWNFTGAAVLDALFDLLRRKGVPDAWDAWATPPQPRVPVGVSLPLFDTDEEAVARIGQAVEAGFRRIKVKVAPGMNLAPLGAAREAFPAIALGFDANGTLGEADAPFVEALAALAPAVLEQPFAPGRIDLCAALKAHLPGLALCLDESVDGLGTLITAHRLGALDELNLKPGRVGGSLVAARMLAYCDEHGIPVWIGGMFETGVGRAANLRLAARLPKAPAHDLSPPICYLAEDVVQHPLTMDGEGFIPCDDQPVQPDAAALERFTIRRIVLTKK